MLEKIVLIHPTKCAGTTISKRLFTLKGFSEINSSILSGYTFNRFFQENIQIFYFIIHSRNLILYFSYLLFYFLCLLFKLRNIFSKHKFGLTFSNGSIQHFTYREWKKINKISSDTICIGIVTHPQHRIVSSFYFLGYHNHYNFLEFLYKIKDGSLLKSIRFSGFRAIIQQHLISMYDTLISNNSNNINFLFKRELLDDDWKEFCNLYQITYTSLRHINKTKKNADWKNLYRIYPEASSLVYELYKKDFDYFDYKIYDKK